MNDKTRAPLPIACDMRVLTPPQREMHLATSRVLFSYLTQKRELSNGYEFRLDGPNAIVKAAEFISLEKLCCPFLGFAIEVEPEGGPLWLRLTGRDGVKAFIREEISGLLGGAIDWR